MVKSNRFVTNDKSKVVSGKRFQGIGTKPWCVTSFWNFPFMTMRTPRTFPHHYITERIRGSGEYAGDISETVFNYLVEEQWL